MQQLPGTSGAVLLAGANSSDLLYFRINSDAGYLYK